MSWKIGINWYETLCKNSKILLLALEKNISSHKKSTIIIIFIALQAKIRGFYPAKDNLFHRIERNHSWVEKWWFLQLSWDHQLLGTLIILWNWRFLHKFTRRKDLRIFDSNPEESSDKINKTKHRNINISSRKPWFQQLHAYSLRLK